jgi:hypothetical protein
MSRDRAETFALVVHVLIRQLDELLSTQKMLEVIPPNDAVEMSQLFGT